MSAATASMGLRTRKRGGCCIAQYPDVGAGYGTSTGHVFLLLNAWYQTLAALLGAGQLVGFGVLIELVDRIHWNGLSTEERAAKLKPGRIMLLLRFWPRQPSP